MRRPYTVEGFVIDMSPQDRRLWHRNALEVLTRVGKVDWRAAGFDYLDMSHHGPLGPEQRQGYFRHYLDWATKGEIHPVAHPAFERLLEIWPDDGEHIELCWGDARVGNQMSRGTEIIGVFDWEMVSLGQQRVRSRMVDLRAALLDGGQRGSAARRPARQVRDHRPVGGVHGPRGAAMSSSTSYWAASSSLS